MIILLRGFSQSGKDYIGKILCSKYRFIRFAFADSLKAIIASTYGCPVDKLHSQKGKLEVCPNDALRRTYRQILIDEALYMRGLDPGVFAKHCCKGIRESGIRPSDNIVITDFRYENEIDIVLTAFPEHTIRVIHVIREGQTESPVKDKSEYQLMSREGDYVIRNDMTDSIFECVNEFIITNT